MRLDAYLAQNNIYDSRTRAVRAIKEGRVKVNGVVITKTSYDVCDKSDSVICGEDPLPYVSRGALKLERAGWTCVVKTPWILERQREVSRRCFCKMT